VPTLRLPAARPSTGGHSGEVFACAFTPDGSHVLSGGWDGQLRLWEADTGTCVTGFRAGDKAVSACAVCPSGNSWLSGTLHGQLTVWDARTQTHLRSFQAHTRPISAIRFGSDDNTVITASWDGNLTVWDMRQERDGRTLHAHADIVAGCLLTPDGGRLLSWSHDGTLRLWGLKPLGPGARMAGHADRVTAAALSPDGRWAASGSRDGALKLWDLDSALEAHGVKTAAEVRGLFFLPDGEALVLIDGYGRVALHAVPDLEPTAAVATRLPVLSADLNAAGTRLALGCGDGRVYFVAVEGCEQVPLLIIPTQTSRRSATPLQRLLGRSTVYQVCTITCPACRYSFEVPRFEPGGASACPQCRRNLRMSQVARVADGEG
jgi:WD40 repeat protein